MRGFSYYGACPRQPPTRQRFLSRPVLAAAVRDWANRGRTRRRCTLGGGGHAAILLGLGLGFWELIAIPMQLQQLACDSAPRLSSTAKAPLPPCRPCRHPGLPSRSHPARPGRELASDRHDGTRLYLPARRAARYADGGLGAGDKGRGNNDARIEPWSFVPSPQSPIRISSGAPAGR